MQEKEGEAKRSEKKREESRRAGEQERQRDRGEHQDFRIPEMLQLDLMLSEVEL